MTIVKEGFIIDGEYSGWKLLVDDDRDGETGGYYVYLKKSDNEGFDCWFEHNEDLQSQLGDFNVEWINK